MADDGIGASVRRKEDQRFLTGKGHFTDDISRPGQVYARFVRSPHAHASIGNIDTSAALSAPGVLGVYTGKDLAEDGVGAVPCGWTITQTNGELWNAPPHEVLATEKVRYVGDQVALVVAETLEQAR